MRKRLRRAAPGLMVLFVVALGFAPHLVFSATVGEPTFFKAGYDEDSYFIVAERGLLGLYRFLSASLERVLFVLSGHSVTATFALMDVLFPLLATVAALFLSSQIVAALSWRLLLTTLLLFGQDLFSLGNTVLWTGSIYSLALFRSLFGDWGATAIPYYETSYLTLFRSPEPQVSYALVFTLLALLVRIASADGTRTPREVLPAVGLVALLPFAYLFAAVPAMLVVVGLALVLFVAGRPRLALPLAAAATLAAVVIVLEAAFGKWGAGLIYASRGVIVTPAVIASAVATGAFAAMCIRRRLWSPVAWLALGLLAVPMVLCNQQVLTGIMVSARDWERNANYPFLSSGFFLACRLVITVPNPRTTQMAARLAGVVVASIALVVAVVQLKTYRLWFQINALSVAMARALAASDVSRETRLVLDNADLAPLLAIRSGASRFVLDYTEVAITRVPDMGPSGTPPESPHERGLFEYWWRTGLEPARAEQLLRTEAASRGGFFLAFLFSFRDYWYPATDNRLVRQVEIERSIPDIVRRYQAFLATAPERVGASDVVRLTTHSSSALPPSARLDQVLLGSGQAAHVSVYAYRQVPR